MTLAAPHRIARSSRRSRKGLSPAEVIVILVILSVVLMVVLFSLPRRRESARLAGCRRNLMQVGVALSIYDRSEGCLPTVPTLVADPPATGGPLRSLLDSLVLPDLTELTDATKPPPSRPGQVPGERFVPGFVCPSDMTSIGLIAPVSYRATAGDQPTGLNGGFAPGHRISLAEVEDGDGRGFTAAFSERLLGDPRGDLARPVNYRIVPGPVSAAGCPTSPGERWSGDAGRSWAEASWRSTLYNHALTPGASPSCVASDGSSALMGASSGHSVGVNVLIFDGSVRTIRPTVAPPIWQALATTKSAPRPPEPVTENPTKP